MRLGKRGDVAWAVGVAVLGILGGLAAILWAGDRLAMVVIDAMVKAVLWGFGFGWLKGGL